MKNCLTNMFLIGPMGSGKTTIARQLARSLGMTFVDSDQEIEKQTGVDIPIIFEYEGEAGFRNRESSMIDALTQRSSIVLATGGGAVLDPQNRLHLKNRGLVIYLRASIAALTQRTNKDPHRPLLQQTDNVEKKIRELMQHREPLYTEIADLVFDTSREHSSGLVKKICAAVQQLRTEQENHDTHNPQP